MDENESFHDKIVAYIKKDVGRMLEDAEVRTALEDQVALVNQYCRVHELMFGVPYGPIDIHTPLAQGPHNWWALVEDLVRAGVGKRRELLEGDWVYSPRKVLRDVRLHELSLNMEPSLFPVDPPRRIS